MGRSKSVGGREPLVRTAGPQTTYVLDADDVSRFSNATKSTHISLYDNKDYLDIEQRFPWFTAFATLSQIALYLTWIYVGGNSFGFQDKEFDEIGGPEWSWLEGVSPFSSCSNQHYQVWRFVTYIWVHANIWHLVSNMIMQFFVGASLESVHGFWRVGLLYLLGGIAGGLNVNMFQPDTTVVGASGAIYALLGMVCANLWLNWEDMPLRWWRLLVIVVFVVNEGFMFLYAYDPFTSYVCHAGGFAFGGLAGVVFLRNLNVTCCEKAVGWLCGILLLLIVAAWVTWWGLHEIPSAAIIGDRMDTCCTNILRYGLPLEGTTNGDYVCVNPDGKSNSLFDSANNDVYSVYDGGWVQVE